MPIHMITIVMGFTKSYVNWPKGFWYINISLFCASIFATMIIYCILEIGNKFYNTTQGYTLLFKMIIILLILCNLYTFIEIYLCHKKKFKLVTLGLIFHYIMFVLTGTLAFLYSFKPVFCRHINPSAAAIGVWYASTIGVIIILSIMANILIYLIDISGDGWFVFFVLDFVFKVSITMFIGFNPPRKIVLWIKFLFFTRNMFNSASTRERGVISSGMVDNNFV